ncbi:hypothetical protein [Streptomyces sp. NPDC058989]|uniref:hypothetical protein n=1 Tax=Streptomyces sp. NPDC058989 TaxID=3346686 RepID=UPI00367B29BB
MTDTSGASPPEAAVRDTDGGEGGPGRVLVRLVLAGGLVGAVLLTASLVVGLTSSPTMSVPRLPKMPSLPTDPGSMPTGFPTGLPTGMPSLPPMPTSRPSGPGSMPTDFPTGLPTDLPTNLPSLPPLPTDLTGGGS